MRLEAQHIELLSPPDQLSATRYLLLMMRCACLCLITVISVVVLHSMTENQCHAGRLRWRLFSSWKRSKEPEAEESSTKVSKISRKDKCKCECDEDDEEEEAGVQLMAMEKVVKVPKIKIHDFGKKEDWEIAGKMSGMDVTNPYSKGRKQKLVMRTQSMSEPEADSAWEVAGKYDFQNEKWEMDGKPGLDFTL